MQIFTEYRSELFLKKYGIKVSKSYLTNNAEKALELSRKMKFPVAIKIMSPDILHKTEAGAIIVCRNEVDILTGYETLLNIVKKRKVKLEGILIQEYLTGNEIIIGIKKDETFGHVILFGIGGIYTEVLKDISFRSCPVSKKEALKMIEEIKNIKILEGYRTQKPVDKIVLSSIISTISKIPLKNKTISELDINPLIANGKSIIVVDARMILD
ncbi:acetate--CoA ligase family protein [Candidatus Woesearchaeota archaeon]|nr:acetate--CoA ligase family protein [Candidatus Woesearchaeota archaeon]